jgi:DNA invertase Pin-like site-specific DNA recombinase
MVHLLDAQINLRLKSTNESFGILLYEFWERISDINSKVLAFAFGLSAEIERNLISQRTKEALARKRAEGVILGRPMGRKSAKTKLTGQEKKNQELLSKDVSYSAIGRILGVHRLTVSSFVKNDKFISLQV